MTTRIPAHPFTTAVATARVSNWYIAAIGLAQFGIFIAILSPVMVSMQLKAQVLNPDNPAAVLAVVLPIGTIGAVIGNPLWGMLSDRTRTRWGRRRPWLLGGSIVLALGLAWVSVAPDVTTLAIAWLVCQLGSNAAFAALVANFADNVPEHQRGKASSVLGLAQNVSILAGTYVAAWFAWSLPLVFILPGLFGVLCVVVYVIVTPDRLPENRPKPFRFTTLVSTFWTNPIRNPDFGFAWWSRFLITLASFLFTTFRLLYMEDHLKLPTSAAVPAVATGVLIYTIALFVAIAFSGWLSDKLNRRKVFVAGSTLLFGVGLVVLAFANDVGHFYVAEGIMGFAFGIYVAVDNALIVDVLPDPEKPGKDLGVINIANSLPQSFGAAIGLFFLSIGGGTQNYPALLWAAGIIALIGAVVVLPIKKVR
ncbi:MFS transporter [Curtobacterium sp. ISL-83]|uniref:MFS transporter n=1 Tax=Curtobacterium sp. ISL-83 TaxID=2819145 RepID=UPI001BEC0ABD|nr:MFS transporter [Curtobacterium sp. ISL-83]MBT2501721.1 MFS transporter [Curtobacterium sp. ISL-83]